MPARNNFSSRVYVSEDPKTIICQLCSNFYDLGWVTGSGGGMSIKVDDKVYVAPSGVQKEDLIVDDVFTLSAVDKNVVLEQPRTPFLTQSACTPLWYEVFKYRPKVNSVIHTHSMNAQLCTLLNGDMDKEFRITHFEMLKGVGFHGYEDELIIPIIDNRPTEDLLAEQLGEAVQRYPKANAVLVRRHGVYVWGDSWTDAKIHAECYDYLFETALKAKSMGIDVTAKPKFGSYNVKSQVPIASKRKRENPIEVGREEAAFSMNRSHKIEDDIQNTPKRAKVFLFDIEGTTTPITFVKDVLFPYASNNVKSFLQRTWDSPQTKEDIRSLLEQALADQSSDLKGVPTVTESESKEEMIEMISEYVQWNITEDRKISALKQLQGRIWSEGYQSGDLKSLVYEDVKRFFAKADSIDDTRIAIYSSGSRHAQNLLFKHSDQGDLRRYLSCYFDTAVGNKRDSKSYSDIGLSLGVDDYEDILFLTDVYEEAVAADAAGFRVTITERPGNAPLPDHNKFPVITTLDDLAIDHSEK